MPAHETVPPSSRQVSPRPRVAILLVVSCEQHFDVLGGPRTSALRARFSCCKESTNVLVAGRPCLAARRPTGTVARGSLWALWAGFGAR